MRDDSFPFKITGAPRPQTAAVHTVIIFIMKQRKESGENETSIERKRKKIKFEN